MNGPPDRSREDWALTERMAYEFAAIHARFDRVEAKLDRVDQDREDHGTRLAVLESTEKKREAWTIGSFLAALGAIFTAMTAWFTRG